MALIEEAKKDGLGDFETKFVKYAQSEPVTTK